MKRERIEDALNKLVDELAAFEHERWSHWQRYMHGKGVVQPDGSLLLPASLVKRWADQIQTDYAALTEQEKESDREQVRKYLPVIAAALSKDKE
jgi:hypothetical protein